MSNGVRFAPSPTGRFHVGNLRTAWVSHEWARARKEPWVVRFEDIDHPRVLMDAADVQLADLRALGLNPDLVLTQSHALSRHWELFQAARAEGQVYPCFCSRKEVREALEGIASAPHSSPAVYSGACRPADSGSHSNSMISAQTEPTGPGPGSSVTHDGSLSASEPIAWRFRETTPTGVDDFLIARAAPNPSAEHFTPAYHWACAVDDYDGDYTLLVRAHDLKVAAEPQRAIQRWIAKLEGSAEFTPPAIFHASLIVQADGHRLEKRTQGVTLGELTARGISASELCARFARTFDSAELRRGFRPGEIFGEGRETLLLGELGL